MSVTLHYHVPFPLHCLCLFSTLLSEVVPYLFSPTCIVLLVSHFTARLFVPTCIVSLVSHFTACPFVIRFPEKSFSFEKTNLLLGFLLTDLANWDYWAHFISIGPLFTRILNLVPDFLVPFVVRAR